MSTLQLIEVRWCLSHIFKNPFIDLNKVVGGYKKGNYLNGNYRITPVLSKRCILPWKKGNCSREFQKILSNTLGEADTYPCCIFPLQFLLSSLDCFFNGYLAPS